MRLVYAFSLHETVCVWFVVKQCPKLKMPPNMPDSNKTVQKTHKIDPQNQSRHHSIQENLILQ